MTAHASIADYNASLLAAKQRALTMLDFICAGNLDEFITIARERRLAAAAIIRTPFARDQADPDPPSDRGPSASDGSLHNRTTNSDIAQPNNTAPIRGPSASDGSLHNRTTNSDIAQPINTAAITTPTTESHCLPVPEGRRFVATGEAQRNPWNKQSIQPHPGGVEESLNRGLPARTSEHPDQSTLRRPTSPAAALIAAAGSNCRPSECANGRGPPQPPVHIRGIPACARNDNPAINGVAPLRHE